MTDILFRSLLAVTALTLGACATAQENVITIRFIGNCGLHLTDGTLDVYTDFPYKSGAFNYMEYPASEIDSIRPNATHLFTHRHPDHYQKKLVKRTTGTVYGPWKVKKKRLADLTLPEYASAEFTVEAFRTKHSLAKHHYSYLITWHGKRIYVSGDAESPVTIAAMDNLDIAFVPKWIMLEAHEQGITLKSDRFAIYHFYPMEKPITENPKIQLLVDQGEVLKVPY
ncbi:MAG: hypothetical protein WAR83_11775 [Flavobacteriales bacterium]|nr:MBL fold metallo-hydrolase [Flavobacteriales bacterium]